MYQLKNEYLDTYERVELYATLRHINKSISEEMLGDFYDLLISAQRDGKKVESIIGSNLKLFCRDYFSEYDIKARLSEIPVTLFRYVVVILILEIVFILIDKTSISYAVINWFPYIIGISAGMVTQLFVWAIVEPLLFRFRKVKTIIYNVIILLILISSLVLSVRLVDVVELNTVALPVIIISSVYIVIFIMVRWIINMKKYGQLRQPRSIYKRPLLFDKEQFNAEFYTAIKKQMLKRYEGKNKKRIKACKGELGTEEYIAMVKKDIDRMPIIWKIMKIFYGILIVAPTCWNFADCIAEGSLQSAIIESAIMCAVYMAILMPIYHMCKKNDEKGISTRLLIIEKAERHNVDLIEYLKHGSETEKSSIDKEDNLIKISNY